jgi:hypothetical protein
METSKSKVINKGKCLVFGVVPLNHLLGVPIGSRVRYRMRNSDYLKAFIKDASGVTQYQIEDREGQWALCFPTARNVLSHVK